MKRSDSKGINIFNVNFLGRNKNKEKKAAQKAALAAASLANTSDTQSKKKSSAKKASSNLGTNNKNSSTNSSQYENLNLSTSTFLNGGLSISNTSKQDSSSLNSEDSNEQRNTTNVEQSNSNNNNNLSVPVGGSEGMANNITTSANNTTSNNNNGSISARSIGSITGSLSFDLLDQLKMSNGSDIDSEGYSIRPESTEVGHRKRNGEPMRNKDNDDMNNLYASSSTDSDSDDSDSENNGSVGGPVKVMLKIKPKSEVEKNPVVNNADVLREISKNLQLKPMLASGAPLATSGQNKNVKKRTYYYNYGTANPDQASSGYSSSSFLHQASLDLAEKEDKGASLANSNVSMTRSCSVGSVISGNNSNNFLADFNSFNTSTNQPTALSNQANSSSVLNSSDSLFDFGRWKLEVVNGVFNNVNSGPEGPIKWSKMLNISCHSSSRQSTLNYKYFLKVLLCTAVYLSFFSKFCFFSSEISLGNSVVLKIINNQTIKSTLFE